MNQYVRSTYSHKIPTLPFDRDQSVLLATPLHAWFLPSGQTKWFMIWYCVQVYTLTCNIHVKTKLSLGTSSKAWWCHVYVVFSLSTGVGPVVPADLHCPLPASAAPPAFHQLSIPQLTYFSSTCRVIISGIAFHYTQMFLVPCYLSTSKATVTHSKRHKAGPEYQKNN